LVRELLTAAGISEAVTFGFIETRAAEMFAEDAASATLVSIANPLSAKFDTLRPSLLPGLVDGVAHNRRHGRRDVALFEIGTCFRRVDGERRRVGLAWTGTAGSEHWSTRRREVDFFDAKGLVEHVAVALRVPISISSGSAPFLTPGQAAIVRANGSVVGLLGVIAPRVAESRGAPPQDRIVVAELDLDALACQPRPVLPGVRPLPRHPFVVRDLSIIVTDSLPAEIIRDTIQAAGIGHGAPLVGIELFDRYTGKGVPDDTVSLSFRLTFQAPNRTLTDDEVQLTFDRVLAALVGTHGAVQR
jgi:phenylalanyl-tRNA synthetase beta chain